MGKINVLDKKIAELIAAGEVIERPSSVIKELVENSIDSGSKNITVEIRNGGTTFMKVSDDGCGISRDDVSKAFLRHATSKIGNQNDLDKIATLGFRGEALASIAAVSKVEVFTRTDEELAGTHYLISGSQEESIDDVGCAKGMTIIIRDLFYNVPARMKFLKKDVSEANSIAAIVDRIALSHPEVSFKFIRDKKEELSTSGNGDIKSCIYSVYGKNFSDTLISVKYSLSGVNVFGFISSSKSCRPNRSMQHFFVNGRYVKSKTAMVAMEQAYKGSIMVGKFPACILYINIPCEVTDVNVHPAKLEIRFIDEKPIFNAVYHAVKSALSSGDVSPELHFLDKKQTKKPIENESQIKISKTIDYNNKESNNELSSIVNKENKIAYSYTEKPLPKADDKKDKDDIAVYVPKRNTSFNHTVRDSGDFGFTSSLLNTIKVNKSSLIEENKSESKNDILKADKHEIVISNELKDKFYIEEKKIASTENRCATKEKCDNKGKIEKQELLFGRPQDKISLIGEAFSTYIILENGNDELILIDKHAAHERLIYEKLKSENNEEASQILLTPVTVTLDKNEYAAILQNIETFAKVGFDIEDFGMGTVLIRAVPLYLEREDVSLSVIEMAGYILQNKKDINTEYVDWLYHNIACRAAVKAGQKQDNMELIELVKKLCQNPDVKHCPHGRPVYITLKKKEIEKQFGRVQ